jgi:hypothetical protein
MYSSGPREEKGEEDENSSSSNSNYMASNAINDSDIVTFVNNRLSQCFGVGLEAEPQVIDLIESLGDKGANAVRDDVSIDEEKIKKELLRAIMDIPDTSKSIMTSHLLHPEEFEKDVLPLGHIAFTAATSNLRCKAYHLREVDQMEVQKIAGKIVPAVVTTTALVAGLVSLELLKIAGENVRRRARKLKIKSIKKYLLTVDEKLAALARSGAGKRTAMMATADSDHGKDAVHRFDKEKDRLLQRFRNAFVNLALPMAAFTQPVMAEKYSIQQISRSNDNDNDDKDGSIMHRNYEFTLWDTLSVMFGRKALPYIMTYD